MAGFDNQENQPLRGLQTQCIHAKESASSRAERIFWDVMG